LRFVDDTKVFFSSCFILSSLSTAFEKVGKQDAFLTI
jgi:hypothetical protein